jgi:excinuclease UvrABC ATPase subunit
MVPFFKRLAEEGLWEGDARWNKLTPSAEATIMYGFWIRPSHGTFRKAGSEYDGSEANHWLRWDGLVSALDGQLSRSKNSAWVAAVNASRHSVACPSCRGSGLGPNAGLLENGGKALDAWSQKGKLSEFLEALESLRGLPPRAVCERKRLLHCLAPLRATNPSLRDAASGAAAAEVVRRAAREFADLAVVGE